MKIGTPHVLAGFAGLLAASGAPHPGVRSAPAQVAGVQGTLVVVNKGDASVSIVDVATGRALARLPTGEGPHEVALSSDGRTAVITDYGADEPGASLTVVDLPALRVVRTIPLGEHRRPHGIAFLPGDTAVAVTSEATGHVLQVDVAEAAIRRARPTRQSGSHMLTLAPRGGIVWTSNAGDGSISEIDLFDDREPRIVRVPPRPEAIAVSPDGGEVWVGSNQEGRVSVLDVATGAVSEALDGFAWPYRILFTGDGETALIPDLSGERLVIVDRRAREVLRTLSFPGAGPQGVTLDPTGRLAFLSLSREDRVAVIEIPDGAVLGFLRTGSRPDGLAFAPRVVPAP